MCGLEVPEIVDSDLYLSYVIGTVEARSLLTRRERHIRCNPAQAQFIVDERFPPVICEGAFGKQSLDPTYVAQQEELITRGWQRLQELRDLGLPISEYPLPDVRKAPK